MQVPHDPERQALSMKTPASSATSNNVIPHGPLPSRQSSQM